jgi:hypothetical protein
MGTEGLFFRQFLTRGTTAYYFIPPSPFVLAIPTVQNDRS